MNLLAGVPLNRYVDESFETEDCMRSNMVKGRLKKGEFVYESNLIIDKGKEALKTLKEGFVD